MASSKEMEELEALMRQEFFADKLEGLQLAIPQLTKKAYTYQTLPRDEVIRVLRLGKGSQNDILTGTLVEMPLKAGKRKKYEAISYSWGSGGTPHEIVFPEGTLQITRSLFTGLIRLRRRDKTRLLWIDALCINQGDNDEKATQIMLMRKIYSLASTVLVWLGEDDGNGKQALQLLEKIAIKDFTSLPTRKVTAQWMQDHDFPPAGDPLWYCLLSFWQRPWFRRSWVVQEFVMAKQVLMICGDWEVPWKALASASEKMLEYTILDWATLSNTDMETEKSEAFAGSLGMRVMMEIKSSSSLSETLANVARSFASRDESALQELDDGSWGKISGVKEMVHVFRRGLKETNQSASEIADGVEGILANIFRAFGAENEAIRLPMVNLLLMFEKTEATIPRDKLFAVLGLASDGTAEELRPNYNETDEEVLTRYGKYFVRNDHGMSMIYQAGIAARDPQSTLPSWVAEFTNNDIGRPRLLSLSGRIGLSYKATQESSPIMRLGQGNALLISGSRVSTITQILTFPSLADCGSIPDYFSKVEDFLETCSSILNSRTKPYPSDSGEPHSEILWRTLVGNMGVRPFYAPDDWNAEFENVRRDIRNADPKNLFPNLDNTAPLYVRMMTMLVFYDFAVIGGSEGMIGIVPKESDVGDEVVLFHGGRMPFVLKTSEDRGQDKFILVGGAYVHGIMNGEAYASESWKEETFSLI